MSYKDYNSLSNLSLGLGSPQRKNVYIESSNTEELPDTFADSLVLVQHSSDTNCVDMILVDAGASELHVIQQNSPVATLSYGTSDVANKVNIYCANGKLYVKNDTSNIHNFYLASVQVRI